MGIHIKGMEMPKDGTFNIVYIYGDGHIEMPFWGKGMQTIKGVTAVPIPPHGDLIDRDKLFEDDPEIHEDWIDSDGYCWDSVWGYTREQIKNAPTVITPDEEDDKE